MEATDVAMPQADAPVNAATDTAATDAAIARVLQAEQAAREAVARCAAEAQATVDAARESARRIAARAAERTARVSAWAAVQLQARLAELERDRIALKNPAQQASPDADRLGATVQRLADDLTSWP